MRKRTVRLHALRAKDQIEDGGVGRWWVVVRPLEANEVVKWKDRDGDHEGAAPNWIDPDHHVCLLVKRGSRHKIFTGGRNALVKIMRPA
jgi:hypothetical protein